MTKHRTKFHQCHGENVMLFEDRTVALRSRGFADALVFSERPLRSGEIFVIDVELKEGGWNGHLRLGLTTFVPSENVIPKYSLPNLTSSHPSWIFAVSKRFMFEPLLDDCPVGALRVQIPEAVLKPEKFCRDVTDLGSRLAITYVTVGDTAQMFFITKDVVKICAETIPVRDPLYAVVDVYGKTRQVRLVQINNVISLLEASRDAVVSSLDQNSKRLKALVDSVRLPVHLKQYLLSFS